MNKVPEDTLTCLSTVMMKNSMEKHRMYPE